MLCGCVGLESNPSPVIDIEELIKDYVWREFKKGAKWFPGVFFRRNDFVLDVPWNFFEFEHKTIRFTPRQRLESRKKKTDTKSVDLFSTNLTNDTGSEQSYKVKVQRQTKATTTVTYQRGYTIKGSANFKLEIPAVFGNCGVSAGIDGQLTVTKSRGETFEDTYNWETDTEVKVESEHVTTVKMIVTEDELEADYEVVTTLSMPSGQAPVSIRRRRNPQLCAVILITDLNDVFQENIYEGSIITVRKQVDEMKRVHFCIDFRTTGILKSVRWKDQRIYLQSNPLAGDQKLDLVSESDDIPLDVKDIYSRVLQHATRGAVEIHEEENKLMRNKETKVMRFPTIPTIITEVMEDLEGVDEAGLPLLDDNLTTEALDKGENSNTQSSSSTRCLTRAPCIEIASSSCDFIDEATKLSKVTSV